MAFVRRQDCLGGGNGHLDLTVIRFPCRQFLQEQTRQNGPAYPGMLDMAARIANDFITDSATTGMSTMRLMIRTGRLGQPKKAKMKMLMSMTIMRKFVPQRGWSVEKGRTFSTTRGSPCS